MLGPPPYKQSMLAYYQYHPLTKQAGITDVPSALMTFVRQNTKSLQAKLRAMRQPGYFRNAIGTMAREYKPELIGGAIGIGGGAYIGNKAFNNSLPPVRTLPHLEQSPYLEVERPYGNFNG